MSFLDELKQRKVIRVAMGYIVASWIAIQAASIALPAFEAPEWTLRAFILLFVLGFPLSLFLSWALDVTPEGIKPAPSSTGNTLLALVVIAGMTAAIGWYYFRMPAARRSPASAQPAAIVAAASPPPAPAPAPAPTTAAAAAPAGTPPATPPRAEPQPNAASPAVTASAAPASPSPRRSEPAGATPAAKPGAASGDAHASPTVAHCRELGRKLYQEGVAEVAARPLAQRQVRRDAIITLREAGCIEQEFPEFQRPQRARHAR